jgi:hypothetical protein
VVVKVWVSTGLVGADREVDIEIEDGSSDAEIQVAAREAMFEMIEWGWSKVGEEIP